MNVWIVTKGSYSDYEILAVFDDEARAREFTALDEDREIATWALNEPRNGQLVRSGYEVYAYRGNSARGWKWHVVDRGFDHWDISRKSPEVSQDGEHHNICVLGTDRDHARKIVQDLIAESNARREGIA